MKIKVILTIMVVALALGSCTSNNEEQSHGRIPIQLTADVLTTTRATGDLQSTQFDDGTEVLMNLSLGTAAAQNYYFKYKSTDNLLVPLTASGGSETTLYYPEGLSGSAATDVTINYAYAPSTMSAGAVSVEADQSSTANYKLSDLVWCSTTLHRPATYGAAAQTVTFKHMLSKFRIKVTKGTGVGAITSIKLKGVKTSYTFTPSGVEASVVTSPTGFLDVTIATGSDLAGSNYYTVAIPAQTINSSTAFLEITTDVGTVSYKLDADKVLVAGKQYTMDITVDGIAVGLTDTIMGWNAETEEIAVESSLTVLNVTQEHVGWLITSDGSVYKNKAAVDAASKTAVAMIAYIGAPGTADASGNYRGLAFALRDANNGSTTTMCNQRTSTCLKTQYNHLEGLVTSYNDLNGIQYTMSLVDHISHTHNGAIAAVSNNSTAAPKGTSGWFLPTTGQWRKMIKGLIGGEGPDDQDGRTEYMTASINAKFSAAGLSNASMVNMYYWTSTEVYDELYSGEGNKYQVFFCYRISLGRFGNDVKNTTNYVRSVLAF